MDRDFLQAVGAALIASRPSISDRDVFLSYNLFHPHYMRTISFPISFIFDVDEPYQTCFKLELSDQDIQALKQFIKTNPGIPFWGMDYDLPELADRMINAHTAAIVSRINEAKASHGEAPITEEDISWEYVEVGFDWPEELTA